LRLAPTVFLQARVAQIVTGLGTYFGCLAYDRLTGTEDNTETVRRRAQQLRETLTDLGPSFIKAGQVLANRPDIVREDYMNELCILQVGICWCSLALDSSR
jgi:predicted unusual protein kinase regulating ubiquinone biosynthesis (AarF/ABC1/UbiB family)